MNLVVVYDRILIGHRLLIVTVRLAARAEGPILLLNNLVEHIVALFAKEKRAHCVFFVFVFKASVFRT